MKLLHYQQKGHLGQYEDWWYYDAARNVVRHEKDHVSVGTLESISGETEYKAEDFLKGNHNQKAKDALSAILSD
jgi:hypothetical protein